MKNKLLSIFATILAVQTYSAVPAFAQVPDTSFTPSDGLVFGTINPEKTVILKLVNKTNQTLNYQPVNDVALQLSPQTSGELKFTKNPQRDYLASVFIEDSYNNSPLIYKVSVQDNVVTVEIQPTIGENPYQNRTIYIDQAGSIFAF